MIKNLIAVKACWQYSYEPGDVGAAHKNGKDLFRAQAIRDTWYKTWKAAYQDSIDVRFFYGHKPEDRGIEENSVVLDCPDDYPNLPQKTRKIFEWALERNYEAVFCTDDDCYIWIARLVQEVRSWTTLPTYRGYANGWFCSGAGYWVNRPAMKLVLSEPWEQSKTTFEDQWVGKCLEKHGTTPEHDERYVVCPCDICLKKIDTSKRLLQLTSDPKTIYSLHATV